MNTTPQSTPPDSDHDHDRLITRLIDGEATLAEYDQFDKIAEAEPSMWRELATRQLDMKLLAEAVEHHTARAIQTPLPALSATQTATRSGRSFQIFPRRLSWPLTMSGWAAAIIAIVSWGAIALVNQQQAPALNDIQPMNLMDLSAEDHYEAYRSAPYVLGEMQPMVLDVEELSDGRIAVRFIRRIEEIALLNPTDELPVDDDGELTSDLRMLRDREPDVSYPEGLD